MILWDVLITGILSYILGMIIAHKSIYELSIQKRAYNTLKEKYKKEVNYLKNEQDILKDINSLLRRGRKK